MPPFVPVESFFSIFLSVRLLEDEVELFEKNCWLCIVSVEREVFRVDDSAMDSEELDLNRIASEFDFDVKWQQQKLNVDLLLPRSDALMKYSVELDEQERSMRLNDVLNVET